MVVYDVEVFHVKRILDASWWNYVSRETRERAFWCFAFYKERMLMELDWSEQSPHIRSLFHPWQPGDGYDEETIQAAEARLGVRLPTTLRNFYLTWGRRRDMTQPQDHMMHPNVLVVRANTLIFIEENQAVCYWGVPCEALDEADPPVVETESGPSGWDVESERNWRLSDAHLSNFLDGFTYMHAFSGGAAYGGITAFGVSLSEEHILWLEGNWSRAFDDDVPTYYIRDGQALFYHPGSPSLDAICCLATREAEALDEIGQRFHISWKRRWQTGKVNNLTAIEQPEHIEVYQSDPIYRQRSWL
jgi:hypothetical protein